MENLCKHLLAIESCGLCTPPRDPEFADAMAGDADPSPFYRGTLARGWTMADVMA
jgi:hypothetical protein